jgi:hypothetical protein
VELLNPRGLRGSGRLAHLDDAGGGVPQVNAGSTEGPETAASAARTRSAESVDLRELWRITAGSRERRGGIIIRVSGVRVPPPASPISLGFPVVAGISGSRGVSRFRRDRCRRPSRRPRDRGRTSARAAFPAGISHSMALWRSISNPLPRPRPTECTRARMTSPASFTSIGSHVKVSHTSWTSATKRRMPSWPEYTSGLKTRSDTSRRKSGAHRAASASASPRFNASWARPTMSVLADTVRQVRRPSRWTRRCALESPLTPSLSPSPAAYPVAMAHLDAAPAWPPRPVLLYSGG